MATSTTTAFHEVLATVRQTAAAHASALDELERALTVMMMMMLSQLVAGPLLLARGRHSPSAINTMCVGLDSISPPTD